MLKKKKIYIMPIFQNIIQNLKSNLMIPIGEGCHYIAEKQSHELLRGIVTKRHSDFVVLLELSSKDTKILEFNQHQKI